MLSEQRVSAPQRARPSLDALTGARFLAAAWVVVYHYIFGFRHAGWGNADGQPGGEHGVLIAVLRQGHLAVDFFFLLSGFILAYTYYSGYSGVPGASAGEERLRGGRRAFWVARVARIYPVYLLGLLLGLGPYVAEGHRLLAVIVSGIAHLLMLQSWVPQTLAWNQPSWSLSVEAFFYLLFPWLLPLFARNSRRTLWLLFLGSWSVFGLIDGVLYMAGRGGGVRFWWWGDVVRYNPIVSLPEFTAGVALGLLFVKYGASAVPGLARRGARSTDALILGTALLLVALLAGLPHIGFDTGNLDSMAVFALPLLSGLMLLLATQRGAIAGILAHPMAVWLGEISYGVYILHAPLWGLLSGLASAVFHLGPGAPVLFPVFLVVVLAVSALSFRYLERPARRAIRGRWGRPDPVPTLVATPAGVGYNSPR